MTATKTILIVEDNNDIRENIVEILELSGYKTLDCENGKKGFEIAQKHLPDLILCDIMMPEMDGFTLLHLLRKNKDTEDIPFIFLTAKTERADYRRGMEMGADDFITKPFEDVELLNAVESRIKRNETHKNIQKAITSDPINIESIFGQLGKMEKLHRKQVLYEEGKHPNYVYLVKSGKIKCVKVSDEGKELISEIVAENDFLGYIPVLSSESYEETAIAINDSEVMALPKDDFLKLIFSDNRMAGLMIKNIAKNVKEKEEKLLVMAYGNLRKRVAKSLVEFDEKFNHSSQHYTLEIKREELASYIGIATESLIRTVSDFKSENLVDIKEGKIIIINKDKLKHLLF